MNGPTEGYSLLLVDDDTAFRDGTRNLLHPLQRELGLTILEADSGAAAMSLLDRQAADCLLLDHHMPGGDGLEWLPKLIAGHPDRAIIMVTGAGSEEIAVAALKKGAVDYLVKGSITRENIYRAVRNALEAVRMRRTIAAQQSDLIRAERQRVMFESLGAACHHLGQPATVIMANLDLMMRKATDSETAEMLRDCIEASHKIADILTRLNQVSEYRTESYLPAVPGALGHPELRILAL